MSSVSSLLLLAALSAGRAGPAAVVQKLHSKRLAIAVVQTLQTAHGKLAQDVLASELATAFGHDGWKTQQGSTEGADFVVEGRMTCEEVHSPGDDAGLLYPVHCSTRVEVHRSGTGAPVLARYDSSVTPPMSNVHVSYERTAFDQAQALAPKVFQSLRTQLYPKLPAEERAGAPLRITVEGIPDAAALKALRAMLSATRSVRSVGAGAVENGRASVELRFARDANALAEALDGKKLLGRVLAVTGVSGDTLSLALGQQSP